MKMRVYVATTVVSYFAARPSRDLTVAARQQATRALWPQLAGKYAAFISALVYQEAEKGDPVLAQARLAACAKFPMLGIDEEARALAEEVLAGHGVPAEFPEDALHIAVAVVNGMDVLVTWNFAHLNNPFTRLMVRQAVENAGYRCPEICTPEELLEVDE